MRVGARARRPYDLLQVQRAQWVARPKIVHESNCEEIKNTAGALWHGVKLAKSDLGPHYHPIYQRFTRQNGSKIAVLCSACFASLVMRESVGVWCVCIYRQSVLLSCKFLKELSLSLMFL